MSKVTKSERITQLEQIAADQARAFKIMADRLKSIEVESKWIIHMTGIERPQLKQLGQSVFDGLDEKWRFAAVDGNKGSPIVYEFEPYAFESGKYYTNRHGLYKDLTHLTGYDASNWQNSLIERDTAKELLEVDLSSELTGSELCRAMLARGDKYVMCGVSDVDDADAASNEYDDLVSDAVTDFDCKDGLFGTVSMRWSHAVPINNQGEPLTAAEAGL